MITITKGQWFPLTLENIMYQGAAFDVRSATELSVMLVSALGQRKALSYEVSGYNELTCVQGGTLAAGKYYVELSCKGADEQSYRMRSPAPLLEISETTKVSDSTENQIKIVGDKWELTADVEMREASARTYMSLLEEARNKALQAATDAEATIVSVQSSVTQAEEAAKVAKEAAKVAKEASASVSEAVNNANNAASNAKADYVGTDNYVYRWDPSAGAYAKTDLYVKGNTGAKGAPGEKMTYADLTTSDKADLASYNGIPMISEAPSAGGTVTLQPNRFAKVTMPDAGGTITIAVAAPTDASIAVDYDGELSIGATVPTVMWDSKIQWGNTVPTIKAGIRYEYSIRYDGSAYYGVMI